MQNPMHRLSGDSAPSDGANRPSSGEGGSTLALALAALRAADELSGTLDANQLLRLATELARDQLGLERVAFYMRDHRAERLVLRGSWGTGAHGETTDEHAMLHELSLQDATSLHTLRATGAVCVERPRAPWLATIDGQQTVIGQGWVAETPLAVAGDLVGVMYNDTALTGAPLEPKRQAAAAVFCNFIAILYASRRDTMSWPVLQPTTARSPLVQRVVLAVDQNLPVRGRHLAEELGVSPGHLARAFKREMGMSLVDYRNKKRIERFREAIQRSGSDRSLKEAAFAAGFGSYAQFHRIYHKFVGSPPRRSVAAFGAAGNVGQGPFSPTPDQPAVAPAMRSSSLTT